MCLAAEQALQAFSFCAGQDPCAERLLLRGQAQTALKVTDRALSDFTCAPEKNPELGIAYQHRGNLDRVRGHLENAPKDHDQARRLRE